MKIKEKQNYRSIPSIESPKSDLGLSVYKGIVIDTTDEVFAGGIVLDFSKYK